MNWNSVAERTKLFAFIWGTVFFAAVSPALFGVHGGYPADAHAPRNATEAVESLFFAALMSCLFGVLPGLVFAVSLGRCEGDRPQKRYKSSVVPVLICAVCELPILFWVTVGLSAEYGPDGWMSGGFRIGIAGYAAALVAGYFVARQPEKKQVSHPKSLLPVYAIGGILVLWMISAVLFPAFQSVEAAQTTIATP